MFFKPNQWQRRHPRPKRPHSPAFSKVRGVLGSRPKRPRSRLSQRCAAFWVPDQNAPARGFLAQARSTAKAATAARRTSQEGLRATEVWVPDQTSGAQAPYFGGLLGPAVRSAAKAATPPQFALRARGQCPLPVCPSPASWLARPDRALCNGVKATEVWIPDQTSGAQAPFFGGLLGPAVRSAAKAATPPQFALRARGQCPLPVCPSPAGLVHRSVRAQCRGVLRCGPGRVGGACLGKKQVGAGTDMRVFSAQPKAGTLPGDT